MANWFHGQKISINLDHVVCVQRQANGLKAITHAIPDVTKSGEDGVIFISAVDESGFTAAIGRIGPFPPFQ